MIMMQNRSFLCKLLSILHKVRRFINYAEVEYLDLRDFNKGSSALMISARVIYVSKMCPSMLITDGN